MTADLLSRLDTHRRQREARGATQQEVQLLAEAHAALAHTETAEARVRELEEAVRLVGLKWSQQAAYLQLAHSRLEGDAVVWGSNLDKVTHQMFCHCADELRAATGRPS